MKSFLKQLLNKKLNNEKGMTLIELLAVIVILAIIAAIAVPAIGNIINNSRDKAVLAEASNVLSAAKLANVAGLCTEDADTITCDDEDIQQHIEGVTLGGNDKAVLNTGTTNPGWTVYYSGLTDIQSNHNEISAGSDNNPPYITETDLNTILDPDE